MLLWTNPDKFVDTQIVTERVSILWSLIRKDLIFSDDGVKNWPISLYVIYWRFFIKHIDIKNVESISDILLDLRMAKSDMQLPTNYRRSYG